MAKFIYSDVTIGNVAAKRYGIPYFLNVEPNMAKSSKVCSSKVEIS
jgi:hypothetical protein